MPQDALITRKLDLKKRAAFTGLPYVSKTANYTALATESGYTYEAAGNGSKEIKFTLPLANACNSSWWSFVAANVGKMIITGSKTNAIVVPGIQVNAVHGVTALNCGVSGNRFGVKVIVQSDGSYYRAWQASPIANANALFYNTLFED